MIRKIRRGLLAGLLSFVLLFLFLEVLLRIFDPFGIHYFLDERIIQYGSSTAGDWIPVPGHYQMSNYEATILSNNTRQVPDTNRTADCTLAFIGDSVTFGLGVEDEETFVNLLAREFPDVHFLNAGVPGYSSDQVLRLKERTAADGYIYLIWDNDPLDREARAASGGVRVNQFDVLYVELYAKYLVMQWQEQSLPTDYPRFWRDLEAIADEHVLLVYNINQAFEEPIAVYMPGAVGIDWRYEGISVVDDHPNAAGHKEAARLLLSAVIEFTERVCG